MLYPQRALPGLRHLDNKPLVIMPCGANRIVTIGFGNYRTEATIRLNRVSYHHFLGNLLKKLSKKGILVYPISGLSVLGGS